MPYKPRSTISVTVLISITNTLTNTYYIFFEILTFKIFEKYVGLARQISDFTPLNNLV